MRIYADYLEIKKDFIPVYTEEGDKKDPKSWKSFIPHEGMRDILSNLLRALDRGKSSDTLPLWIHGTYGTGKTFASFVVKHLLEDNLEDLEDYFEKHEKYGDLWKRLKTLRERGKYLVVYRSSSSNLDSSLKFLAEIQQSVKKVLKEKGYTYFGENTIQDNILDKLTHPHSSFDWKKAFEKHRNKFLEFASADEVTDKIEKGENINLISKAAKILDEEG